MKIRQGDVLLVKIDKLPTNLVKKDRIIAYGEVTGHKHQFLSNQVSVFKNKDEQQYVDVQQKAILQHEEHAHLEIPKGVYQVIIQRELDLLGEVRQVLD